MRNKKTLILGTISIVAVFTVIIFLIMPNFILSVVTSDINLKGENFDGIHLNQNINELEVDEITEDNLNPNFYHLSNGMRVITDEKRFIKNIAITHNTDKTVRTSRGISIGDSLDIVKKSYGEDYYNRSEQGVEIIVYVDNNTFIEFWHFNNEVQEIRFGYNGIN